jgi:hypothetical protein
MADKKTTLKTKAGDNVYPNVLEDNVPATIARVADVDKTIKTTKESLQGNIDAIGAKVDTKQNKLKAGTNITITNDTISASTSIPDNVVLYGELTSVS